MDDFSSYPTAFEALRAIPLRDLSISERLVDPVIVVDRVGGKIVARLGGSRVVGGERRVYVAPTNAHVWVVDGATIRPLPRDSAQIFSEALGDADPSDLPYSRAIAMIRDAGALMPAAPGAAFLQSGRIAAECLDDTLAIKGLTATLFPYQARGVRWMQETIAHTGGLILADEMGLGKTLQIIALLLTNPPQSNAPALIVCPTSLIANWMREFERFAPAITLMVHRGAGRAGVYSGLQKTSVVITTYDTMVNDISIFSSFEWSWVICDEAQAIKNPDSNRHRAVIRIPRARAIAMTGTPVENSLLDLWALTDFVIPGLLGERHEFETTYPDGLESARAVTQLTDPVILRRRVADVARDLPDRIDVDLPLDLGDHLSDHYIRVREETLSKYPVAGALVATLQLQLLCAHPWLRQNPESDADGEYAEIVPESLCPLMTPKMERVIDLLREAFFNGKKVIVFSLFNRVGDLIRDAAPNLSGVYWGRINGSTPQHERQSIVDEFSAYPGAGCLVLNPKAAGSGLNITAATVVIHFTPVWNPALEAQASARAHRRGQKEPVTVYRLFYRETVEEVMIDRARWKSELANESIPVSSRDAADLRRALEIIPRSM